VRERLLIAGTGLAMFGLFALVRTSLIDDAYITLAYAKNLALHLHWGVIPQAFSNVATSPLNVLSLGALSALTRISGDVHPVVALGASSIALAMTMAWGWIRVIRAWGLPLMVAALGVAIVLVNPFLLSAIGLEVLLIPTCLIVLLAMALEDRPGWFGVVAGLTLLARLDLLVFVLVIGAAAPAVRRRWRRSLLAAAAVCLPWFAFSWIFFGSAVPDTLLIKSSQHWLVSFWAGPSLYFTSHPKLIAMAFLPALIGLGAVAGWLLLRTSVRWESGRELPAVGPGVALGVGGLAYYLQFTVLAVPPYHWYYVPPIASLSMCLVIILGVWLNRARERPRLRPMAPALALGLVGLIVVATLARDLSQGVPWRAPAITSNFATASDYARIGVELRKRIGNGTVRNIGEIGTVAYFCECPIVEQFSDRREVLPLINRGISSAIPWKKLIYELNYLWLDRSQEPRHADYLLTFKFGPVRPPGLYVWPVRAPSTLFLGPVTTYLTLSPLK